jgi:hypothetical protein
MVKDDRHRLIRGFNMASMKWNFQDVYTKVSSYLGTGSTPTGDNLTSAKDIVFRGYMKFLLPINPRDSEIYIWSYLKQPWKLHLEVDKWEYTLPDGFERFERNLEYDPEERSGKIVKVSERVIMASRGNLQYLSYPEVYALRAAKFDPKVGSYKEMIVYPTPTNRSILNSTYIMTPPKPENDEDFFVGGVLESEAILQCCIAVAENEQDEVLGVQTQKAIDLVQALIRKDMGSAPDTIGEVVDSNIRQTDLFAYRRSFWVPKGTYTVYGNEI